MPQAVRLASTLMVSVCCAVVISLASSPTDAAGAAPPDPVPPAWQFGAVETYHEPELADVSGVGWTRIIFYWSELERKGPDDWNEFHAPFDRIDREIAGGREVVGLLQSTPAWATDGIPFAGVPKGLYLSHDNPNNTWASFVREVVSRYEGRINRWIIWNEPDIPLGTYGAQWEGSIADYYQLLKVAYLAAHEANPDVIIHLGGFTYWHNPEYLSQLLTVASNDPTAAANNYYFDIVSLHIYFKPETTLDIVASEKQVLESFGLEKPIWINETNAPPYNDPMHEWHEPVFEITMEMQASFVLQQFALALSAEVERIALYKWADQPPLSPGFEPFGAIRTDGSPRPVLDTYQVVTRFYADTSRAVRYERPEMFQVVLYRPEHITRVLWARSPAPLVVGIPVLSDTMVAVDQSGQPVPITQDKGHYVLNLSGAPCEPDRECLMGGKPVVVIEKVAAQELRQIDISPMIIGSAETDVSGSPRVVPPTYLYRSEKNVPRIYIFVAMIALLTGLTFRYLPISKLT